MAIIGGVDLGNLPFYLFFFQNGSIDANWQGASKGFVGDVAVNGIVASERTSGFVPYAGTIYTNDTTLGPWQQIVNDNPGQASGSTGEVARIAGLQADLISAFNQINLLPATPGFTSRSSTSLNGLNTQNGISETFVINITSGFNVSTEINITGDPGDVYILRWDTDANPANGYQGQVKFQSGGAIVPHGGLTPANFINVAGEIGSSGGGTTPPPPYPQGPRFNDGQGALINGGQDFNGGGFFTGYWLTTGSPDAFDPVTGQFIGPNQSLSNGIFVGGWYTLTTKFSMTSGTSGVHVSPNVVANPSIRVRKQVSADGGLTFSDADLPPGPSIIQGVNPIFRYIVTNTGDVTLTNITLTDDKLGAITPLPQTTLNPGGTFTVDRTGTWAAGQQTNRATVEGHYGTTTVTDNNPANYVGITTGAALTVRKYVSPDGINFFDADLPPGPDIPQGTNPIFRYIVTNAGNTTITNITLTDDKLGNIAPLPTTTLAPGAFFTIDRTGTWAIGQQTNLATVNGTSGTTTLTDTNPANYVGVAATPAIRVIKQVSPDGGTTFFNADLPPGPSILQGTNPVFRYIVTNIGNVTLSNITLSDNKLGPIGPVPATLAPGAFFSIDVTAGWLAGLQTNIATATGQYQNITVIDENPANYTGVPISPSISVIKQVSPDGGLNFFDADLPPGPEVPQGTNPIFRYIVTNTGNVTLDNITLNDNVLGNIAPLPTTTLAPGGSFTIDATGTWASGQHPNLATVTGFFGNTPFTGTNPANYIGVAPAPAIRVVKQVSADGGTTFVDADLPPGPDIPQGITPVFRYIVTNIGNTTLTNITLTDDKLGAITPLPTTTLAPGEFFTIDRTGTWALGQQTNTATVEGFYGNTRVTDSNPANYVGVSAPAIRVIKQVSADGGITFVDADTPPGPSILQGTNPVFRYIVTNIGSVTLSNITLSDNVLGNITPLPTTTLAPGGFFIVERTGTWSAGLNTNLATVEGHFGSITVTDRNPANYTGIPSAPAIKVIKQVSADGGTTFFDADTPPGPSILQGTNPVFRYIVTNIGNVTLTNIALTDDKLGAITPLPTTTLAPGGFFTIVRTGTWASGQQTNTATVEGFFGNTRVTDSNPANYLGITVGPAIDVEKLVSPDGGITFFDADTPPGPIIPQGVNPIFRFIVRNTGNVTLTNISLIDTVLGPIAIPTTTLAPGQFFVVDKAGVWAPCEQVNVATVTGKFGNTTVSDSDKAYYVGEPKPRIFKQLSVEETVSIPSQKPTAEDILDCNVNVVITETYVIKTPKATSYEGQIMTGWKLIVEGKLVQKVVYIANECTQSVHAAEFEMPFSTFIILPEDYKQCQPIQVEGIVEDVFFKQIDGRRIFKNITLRVEGKIKC